MTVCSIDKKKNDRRGTIKNATNPLTLTITHLHVQRAVCENGLDCVIGQALRDLPLVGDLIEFWQVGPGCTKIKAGGDVLRYRTPTRLAISLRLFDKTGRWELPPGQYTLQPYKGAQNRWHKKKKKKDAIGGKQDMFRGHPAAPTRRVMTAKQMLAA